MLARKVTFTDVPAEALLAVVHGRCAWQSDSLATATCRILAQQNVQAYTISHALWHRVVQGQANGGWALDEAVVFGRYDLFAKRCRKLISLFTTIHQFSLLAQVIQLLTLLRISLAFYHNT